MPFFSFLAAGFCSKNYGFARLQPQSPGSTARTPMCQLKALQAVHGSGHAYHALVG